MNPFTTLTATLLPLRQENVDTDQIIPARFLKVTGKSGLGEALFAGWRYLPGGEPDPQFILNRPERQGAQVLVAGDNFGCGSSREHAPWALTGWGFRAVISTSFADIFRSNALKNSLLPVEVPAETLRRLLKQAEADPYAQVHIDLPAQSLRLPDGSFVQFPIDLFHKTCLVEGVDTLGYLLRFETHIAAYEAQM